jgi:hypothetical protein
MPWGKIRAARIRSSGARWLCRVQVTGRLTSFAKLDASHGRPRCLLHAIRTFRQAAAPGLLVFAGLPGASAEQHVQHGPGRPRTQRGRVRGKLHHDQAVIRRLSCHAAFIPAGQPAQSRIRRNRPGVPADRPASRQGRALPGPGRQAAAPGHPGRVTGDTGMAGRAWIWRTEYQRRDHGMVIGPEAAVVSRHLVDRRLHRRLSYRVQSGVNVWNLLPVIAARNAAPVAAAADQQLPPAGRDREREPCQRPGDRVDEPRPPAGPVRVTRREPQVLGETRLIWGLARIGVW